MNWEGVNCEGVNWEGGELKGGGGFEGKINWKGRKGREIWKKG